MKKFLTMILLMTPTLLLAQSAMEGTWRTNMDQARFSPKPYVFSVNGGMYNCATCVPQVNVKADGTDQPVTGQTYDTISIRADSPQMISITGKKDGKVMFEQTRTVSSDGNTLTVKSTSHPKDSESPIQTEVTYARTATGPAGSNATSGSWRVNKVNQNEAALTTTYKWVDGQLSMSQPTGENFTAKLDGHDYPYNGSYGVDTVSLRRVDDHTIEETDKRAGKVISVNTISIAPDGKTMTEVVNNKLLDRTSTFVSEKQSIEAAK
jgi:hypothetical protein